MRDSLGSSCGEERGWALTSQNGQEANGLAHWNDPPSVARNKQNPLRPALAFDSPGPEVTKWVTLWSHLLAFQCCRVPNSRSWRVLETPNCMHTSNWVIDTWRIWKVLRWFTACADLSVIVDSILPMHSGYTPLLKYYPVPRCDMGKWRNLPATLQKMNVPSRGPWHTKKRHHNVEQAVVKIRYCPVQAQHQHRPLDIKKEN